MSLCIVIWLRFLLPGQHFGWIPDIGDTQPRRGSVVLMHPTGAMDSSAAVMERPSSEGGVMSPPRLQSGVLTRSAVSFASREDFDGKVPSGITLSIVVLGASGDLAKKKTYPALFALFAKGYVCINARMRRA